MQQENKPQKKHKHFKMSDEGFEHIYESPAKLAIIIAVVITLILSGFLLIRYNSTSQNKQSVKLNIEQQKMIDDYQQKLGVIMSDFLVVKDNQDFLDDAQVCQDITSQTINKVLKLTVPVEYKDLHLEVVVLLDQELKKCQNELNSDVKLDWQGLITKYPWIKK